MESLKTSYCLLSRITDQISDLQAIFAFHFTGFPIISVVVHILCHFQQLVGLVEADDGNDAVPNRTKGNDGDEMSEKQPLPTKGFEKRAEK